MSAIAGGRTLHARHAGPVPFWIVRAIDFPEFIDAVLA
jgi:hypothetical protein